MAIFEEYDESLFISRFEDYKRVINSKWKGGNFSYRGLKALFEYLDDLSEDTGENIKLDVICLCCEYSEFKDLNEYLNNYNTDINKEDFEEENEFNAEDYEKAVFEEIQNKTTLIKFGEDEEGFIIQQY